MKEKNWIQTIAYVIIPLAVYIMVELLVVTVMQLYMGDGNEADQTLLTGIVCAAALIPLYYIWKKDNREGICAHRISRIPYCYLWPLSFLGGAAASWIMGMLMQAADMTARYSNETQEAFLASSLLLQILVLGILAPVTEELLYRGIFYERLRTVCPKMPAILIASCLFAAGHGNVIQAIYAFPMALILHFLYETGKDLRAPVLFHMGANLFTIVWYLIR